MAAEVLIVDNDDAHRQFMHGVLETVGYEVHDCVGIDDHPTVEGKPVISYRLVFLDTSAIRGTVMDAVKPLLSLLPAAEIVLMTAYQDIILETEAAGIGLKRWLYKPFQAPELILTVAGVLEQASQVGGHHELNRGHKPQARLAESRKPRF